MFLFGREDWGSQGHLDYQVLGLSFNTAYRFLHGNEEMA